MKTDLLKASRHLSLSLMLLVMPGLSSGLQADVINKNAYVKASNTDRSDEFGFSSDTDGNLVVVGTPFETSSARGINGDDDDNSFQDAGAAYVFQYHGDTWTQIAYVKASNNDPRDGFAHSVAVSGDTIAIGAYGEDSLANGVNGDQDNNSGVFVGAVYIFRVDGDQVYQEAYIKASNPGSYDTFGESVSLSGNTLVVGAPGEDSAAVGVNGDQDDNSASDSGAAYVFTRQGSTWSQQAYLKASNTERRDRFGDTVSIDGDLIAVGAYSEDSHATGINGDQDLNWASDSGAVYVFQRENSSWSQQVYIKASNTEEHDNFGVGLAVSGDMVIVGAPGEDSGATGIDADQSDNSVAGSGAVYIFSRANGEWVQDAYIKSLSPDYQDLFGRNISAYEDTFLTTAYLEDSRARGLNGNQEDNLKEDSGAVYMYRKSNSGWKQLGYLKAFNSDEEDRFGSSVGLGGNWAVVTATDEESHATGIDGNHFANTTREAGAAYIFSLPFYLDNFEQPEP